MASNTKVTYEDLEAVLNKYHIRTKTFFFKKSRKLVSVLTDLDKHSLSPEDKYIINQYFMGDVYTHAMERYNCDHSCDCECDSECDCNNCDHE